MSGTEKIRVDEVIAKVKAVSSFLATVASDLGFHDTLGDLGKDGGEGLCHVLRWMEDELGAAGAALDLERDQRGIEALRVLGVPLQALTDKGQRRAWAEGYAHGMAQLERLDPALVAALRKQSDAEPSASTGG